MFYSCLVANSELIRVCWDLPSPQSKRKEIPIANEKYVISTALLMCPKASILMFHLVDSSLILKSSNFLWFSHLLIELKNWWPGWISQGILWILPDRIIPFFGEFRNSCNFMLNLFFWSLIIFSFICRVYIFSQLLHFCKTVVWNLLS